MFIMLLTFSLLKENISQNKIEVKTQFIPQAT